MGGAAAATPLDLPLGGQHVAICKCPEMLV